METIVKRMSTRAKVGWLVDEARALGWPAVQPSAWCGSTAMTSQPLLSSNSAIGVPMRPMPIQPTTILVLAHASSPVVAARQASSDPPIARFDDLLDLLQEGRRIGAVESAMVERLRQNADRPRDDRVAVFGLHDDGPLAYGVGGEDRDLRRIDERRGEQRAERAVVGDRIGAAFKVRRRQACRRAPCPRGAAIPSQGQRD